MDPDSSDSSSDGPKRGEPSGSPRVAPSGTRSDTSSSAHFSKRNDSFERVLHAHGPAVYRLALAQTRNRADAEDVFQDVFVALVRHTAHADNTFASNEHLQSWLLRATINRCRDLARSVRRHRTQSLDELPVDLAENLSAPSVDQGNRPPELEQTRELWRAVGELPPKLRAAIHLFYVEELSCEQTAQALGVSVSTVTTRLSRARKQLERSLKGRLS